MEEKERESVFMDMLPEIYQDDSLLRQIVGVFERLYLELEEQIDDLPSRLYDIARTPEPFLDFVGELVGLRSEEIMLSPAQTRALIPLARKLQMGKGTRPALEKLLNAAIGALCGENPPAPLVVEYDDWKRENPGADAAAHYERLYGGESDFTVLLPGLPALCEPGERERLEKLVKAYSPAFARAHVALMKNETRLGDFCALGKNSYI